MITPEQLASSGSESANQKALFAWAAQSGIPELQWMFAIPNGGLRNSVTGARMKAEGLRSGVSDIFLPISNRGEWYCGLFIEMKTESKRNTKNGGLSDDQVIFATFVHNQGYKFVVAYGWQEARDAVLRYLGKL